MTNEEVLRELGRRFKNLRLGRNTLIDDLADRSVVNRKTILAFEEGDDIRLSSLLKVMRGLGTLSSLEAAFPDVLPGGEGISTRGQPRQKAATTGKRKQHGQAR